MRQKAQKERARCWGLGREGENVSGERENGVGFKSRSTLVDFDRWSKSTKSIFGYRKWPYQHRDILRQCKQSNQHRGYFRKDVCFQQLFWRYNFDSNNTEGHHIVTGPCPLKTIVHIAMYCLLFQLLNRKSMFTALHSDINLVKSDLFYLTSCL